MIDNRRLTKLEKEVASLEPVVTKASRQSAELSAQDMEATLRGVAPVWMTMASAAPFAFRKCYQHRPALLPDEVPLCEHLESRLPPYDTHTVGSMAEERAECVARDACTGEDMGPIQKHRAIPVREVLRPLTPAQHTACESVVQFVT